MVNRGEEKVRVHMNVVPRSTVNTNDETEKSSGPSFVCRSNHYLDLFHGIAPNPRPR